MGICKFDKFDESDCGHICSPEEYIFREDGDDSLYHVLYCKCLNSSKLICDRNEIKPSYVFLMIIASIVGIGILFTIIYGFYDTYYIRKKEKIKI